MDSRTVAFSVTIRVALAEPLCHNRGTLAHGWEVMLPDSLLSLRSRKAQLEVGLIYLKRRHLELQRQLVTAENQVRRGATPADVVDRIRAAIGDHAVQLERHQIEINELDAQISAIQHQVERSGPENLTAESDSVTAELVEVREQILTTLRQLAEPLRRYEALAEKKNLLALELSNRTGRNLAYVNYIESALFRQSEFVDDVRYVVELLRRQRTVA